MMNAARRSIDEPQPRRGPFARLFRRQVVIASDGDSPLASVYAALDEVRTRAGCRDPQPEVLAHLHRFALADHLTVMVNGQVIASGTPAAIRADANVQAAYLGEEESHGAA